MKKVIILFVLVFVISSIAFAETKLKMEIWNRWTYSTQDGEVLQNEMAVKRGYFRLEPKFSQNIKGRFNVDFFSDDDAGDGAGLKMKYAYLDFSNIMPVKDMKLTVGLMKTYFGTIYDWNYTTIEKDPSDKYKFVSSTDYGVGVSGYLPNGIGSYAVAAYNGEGYKKSGDDINKDLNISGNIRIIPIVGVTIGGSYMLKTKNDSEVEGSDGEMIDNIDREHSSMFAGVSKFAFGKASLLAQYLQKVSDMPNVDGYEEITTTVISFMPVYKINSKIDLVGRYDIYDKDTNVDEDKETIIIAGVNFNLMRDTKNKPTLMLQANYENNSYENDAQSVTEFMLQLRWIFSEKINKG